MNANKAMELGFIDEVLSSEDVSDDDTQPAVPVMFSEATVMNSLMGKIAEKCRMVDYITVHSKKDIRVTFKDGTEIKV